MWFLFVTDHISSYVYAFHLPLLHSDGECIGGEKKNCRWREPWLHPALVLQQLISANQFGTATPGPCQIPGTPLLSSNTCRGGEQIWPRGRGNFGVPAIVWLVSTFRRRYPQQVSDQRSLPWWRWWPMRKQKWPWQVFSLNPGFSVCLRM